MAHDALQLLLRHGYALIFIWVLGEQIGLAIPSLPLLLVCGALAARGESSFTFAVAAATCGALVADNVWYQLGRLRGMKILRTLCRISIKPDSCVRRTEETFARYGPSSLLFAKFVPGLGTVAVPLAGASGMNFGWFLALDSLGAIIWSGTIIGLGDLLSNQLETLIAYGVGLGATLGGLLVAGITGWVAWKLYRRRIFLRQIKTRRITPEQLKVRLESGDDVFIADLRHQLEYDAFPSIIPGAVHVDPAEIGTAGLRIPEDREIVLYCT